MILVPNTGRLRFADIVHGIDPKWSPMTYTTTEEFPSHGVIDSSPDITGGMGFEGLGELNRFVREGGLMVTLANAGHLPADGGITRGVRSRSASGTPGSHVTTKVLRPEHPVAFGYDEITHVFRGNLSSFRVSDHDLGRVVMQYGTRTLAEEERAADKKAGAPGPERPKKAETGGSGSGDAASKKPKLCLSGVVKDGDALQRVPAILDVPVGDGRVLLFSWNPLHRHQNQQDFAFLTNALLFHDDFPPTPTEEAMRHREEDR